MHGATKNRCSAERKVSNKKTFPNKMFSLKLAKFSDNFLVFQGSKCLARCFQKLNK